MKLELHELERGLAERQIEVDRLRHAIATLTGESVMAKAPRRRAASKADRVAKVRELLAADPVAVTRSTVAAQFGVSLGYASLLLADARRAEPPAES
jgi:tRNA U54 and U55 pseudouridine synthase Pus10